MRSIKLPPGYPAPSVRAFTRIQSRIQQQRNRGRGRRCSASYPAVDRQRHRLPHVEGQGVLHGGRADSHAGQGRLLSRGRVSGPDIEASLEVVEGF